MTCLPILIGKTHQAGIHRLALHRQDAGHTLVDLAQRLRVAADDMRPERRSGRTLLRSWQGCSDMSSTTPTELPPEYVGDGDTEQRRRLRPARGAEECARRDWPAAR